MSLQNLVSGQLQKYMTSMSSKFEPVIIGHVILVSRYLVLAGVN